MSGFRDLKLYQKAFQNAMLIFQISKTFPKEEKFGLTSQIRNSSRSVCSCTSEAYRKRRYIKNWTSKLTDADMENSETIVWLDFALACEYISKAQFDDLNSRYEETGRLINYYIEHPEKFI
jgi:four helix bundle protein